MPDAPDSESLPLPRRLSLPLRRRAAARGRRRFARSAASRAGSTTSPTWTSGELRRRAPRLERGRPGACRSRCAARSSRRSAMSPGRGTPTASRSGSTRATPAPAIAPAAIAISSIFCRRRRSRQGRAGLRAEQDQSRACRTRRWSPPATVPFQFVPRRGGYRLEAFLPAAVLHGFDPEQNPRLGIYCAVRDQELGEQSLSVGGDFPCAEDPSLWSVLELVKEETEARERVNTASGAACSAIPLRVEEFSCLLVATAATTAATAAVAAAPPPPPPP